MNPLAIITIAGLIILFIAALVAAGRDRSREIDAGIASTLASVKASNSDGFVGGSGHAWWKDPAEQERVRQASYARAQAGWNRGR